MVFLILAWDETTYKKGTKYKLYFVWSVSQKNIGTPKNKEDKNKIKIPPPLNIFHVFKKGTFIVMMQIYAHIKRFIVYFIKKMVALIFFL